MGTISLIPEDEAGNKNIRYDFVNNYGTLFTQIDYKDLLFDLYVFSQHKSKIDAIPVVWGTPEQTHNHWNGFFGGLHYNRELSNDVALTVRASYNSFDRVFYSRLSGNYSKFDSEGTRKDAELTLRIKANKNINLIAGGQYEHVDGDHYNVIDLNTEAITVYGLRDRKVHDTTIAGYMKADCYLGSRVRITGGARVANNEDYGTFINPRGGAVIELMRNLYVKFLYGNAYRSPNLFEKYANFPTTYGNEALEPEKIRTIDLGLDGSLERLNVRINYYHAIATDLIGRILQQDNTTKYTNFSGESTFQGVEGELRSYLHGVDAYLNISTVSGRDDNDEIIEHIPELLIRGGCTLSQKKYLGSLNINYVGSVENRLSTTSELIELDPSIVVNAKLGYKLSGDVMISVIVHNLFDEELWAPEFIRKKIGMLQNGSGRSVTIEMRTSF